MNKEFKVFENFEYNDDFEELIKLQEEKEAYEIIVETRNGSTFTTHVEENIQVGQEMQFIVRSDGTITNLDKKNRKFAN